MSVKDKIEQKISISQALLIQSTDEFISSNTRKDRDKLLRHRYKLEAFREILKLV
jgi:hypothetical protein